MNFSSWSVRPDQFHSSYLILATLAGLAATAGILFQIGLIGWVLQTSGFIVRRGIQTGFLIWEQLLSWASWPQFLAIVLGLLFLGGFLGHREAAFRALCGFVALFLGVIACLAYMFIDLERSEVGRGHKAVHNPLKGQMLAQHLARHGHQVRVPLLLSAIVAVVCGFALLNEGLYETIGSKWYHVPDPRRPPIFVDFLAYALTKLLNLVDVLDLAQSKHLIASVDVREAAWPASTMLLAFKSLFTVVLLQQLFSSLRQRKLLAETIIDFWSPHEPIHERARDALPQYGVMAIGPLLVSLRELPSLTKEQRDQLPMILATIGPTTVPVLVRHLNDPHEHVRAIAAGALGLLHVLDTVPLLVLLAQDPSDEVRESVVAALGGVAADGATTKRRTRALILGRGAKIRRVVGWFRRRKRGAPVAPSQAVDLAVETLRSALRDEEAGVRTKAARALGHIGPPAAPSVAGLIESLKDADETVRCQAAEALGRIASEEGGTVPALVELLQDASPAVKAAAARALGVLKVAAVSAVPALVPLLQDRDEAVREAAAEAIARVGPLNVSAIGSLVEGLDSPDNIVRARTAEALGTIGEAASDAAPALVEAMEDDNDRVRAKAIEALGKIGESAATAAVPGLVRALHDHDNWVSALAAEALGEMGESGEVTVGALVRSLEHLNPGVRANSAEALGKMGANAAGARSALEAAARDEDGGVRSQALRALGAIGRPTRSTSLAVLAGLKDPDPMVRIAAVESVGRSDNPGPEELNGLEPLLEDANDQVKAAVTKVLPRLAGATPAVIDGLCRRLLEDDSAWVQVHAALALGKLGRSAIAAGPALLEASRTAEVSVREQAMRAIVLIQPAEMAEAFLAGLSDACGDIRVVASAGWMKAQTIPEEAIATLVESLHDPEAQVRANAAHALGRLEALPAMAIPLLIECTADPYDGLRINAAVALELAPAVAVSEVMPHLLSDSNSRVRLIAARLLLKADPGHEKATTVLAEALEDRASRVRKAALDLVESLGENGVAFLERLKERVQLEPETDLRDALSNVIDRLEMPEDAPVPEPSSGGIATE